MYPFIAGSFARSPQLEKGDFSFIKKIAIGGAVLDPTTVELLDIAIPGLNLEQVKTQAQYIK